MFKILHIKVIKVKNKKLDNSSFASCVFSLGMKWKVKSCSERHLISQNYLMPSFLNGLIDSGMSGSEKEQQPVPVPHFCCRASVLKLINQIWRKTSPTEPRSNRNSCGLTGLTNVWFFSTFLMAIQKNLDLRKRKCDLRKNLDLRKIVATTNFLVHKLFDLGKIF